MIPLQQVREVLDDGAGSVPASGSVNAVGRFVGVGEHDEHVPPLPYL